MISGATEDTITSILRDELEALGVNTKLIPIIDTPAGPRKPDLLCSNGGIYPIEAKFKEKDLLDAIEKVQNDYIKHHKVIGVKGGFAILYPKELSRKVAHFDTRGLVLKSRFKLVAMFPDEDKRGFNVYEGSLPEITQILADYILNPLEEVEPSIDYIIKALRDSTKALLEGLAHLKGEELEGFFGGKNVFENILQYGKDEYPLEELRYAAAYLLMNQLLFYHVLSKIRPDFPEIDPDSIRRPSDLKRYFEKVTEINYEVIFSYDVTSLIPPTFLDQVKTIINIISGLGPQKVGGDLLGTIFHDLIPFEIRKKVAAFYTNIMATEILASLSIDREDSKVADFAVGSGGLLVAAYRRKKALLKRPLDQEDHRRFVEDELLGIDVMPFAANVAACQLALQAPQFFTDKVSMAVWDSTDLRPGKTIPSVADLKMKFTGQTALETFGPPEEETKGVVRLKGNPEKIALGTYDVVIMNPPFTRQTRLPKEYKDLLSTRFATIDQGQEYSKDQEKEYKEYLHGQLGYHGYFILLADRFLEDDGRMALVLPASVLRLQSFEGMRKLWAERYHIEHIITLLHRSAFSESARFREILLVAKKSKPEEDAKTIISVLKKLPKERSEASEVAEAIKSSHTDWEDERVAVKIHSYKKLTQDTSNWFRYIAVSDLNLIDLKDKLLGYDKLIKFNELLEKLNTTVLRGIETARGGKVQGLTISRPDRAIKRNDEWVIDEERSDQIIARNRFTEKKIKIPLNTVKRALRRVSLIDRIDVTDSSDYVLIDSFREEEDYFKHSLSAVRPEKWETWQKFVKDRMCNLALVRRTDISARRTHALAFFSSNLIAPSGLAWAVKTEDESARILCLWFNSTLNVLQLLLERKETRGAFLQLDEYVLEELKAPDLTKLSDSEIDQLLNVFEKVRDVELPSILDQLKRKNPYRQAIDRAWLEILGYEGDADELLDGLYESLADEIELLKRLMAERD